MRAPLHRSSGIRFKQFHRARVHEPELNRYFASSPTCQLLSRDWQDYSIYPLTSFVDPISTLAVLNNVRVPWFFPSTLSRLLIGLPVTELSQLANNSYHCSTFNAANLSRGLTECTERFLERMNSNFLDFKSDQSKHDIGYERL